MSTNVLCVSWIRIEDYMVFAFFLETFSLIRRLFKRTNQKDNNDGNQNETV